jgi:hypothetical protein
MSPTGLFSGAGVAAAVLVRVAGPGGAVPPCPHPASTAAVATTVNEPTICFFIGVPLMRLWTR